MSPPAAPQQQSSDNSLAPLWIILCFFILGWLIWAFFHTQIVAFSLQVKALEAQLIALVVPSVTHLPAEIKHLSAEQVSFTQLLTISREVGTYLRYPIIVILIVLASVIYFSHINLQFKRVYTMGSLVQAEKEDWPQILPVTSIDLVKEDIDKGPWAMALSPMQFAKKHHLLQEEKIIPTVAIMPHLRGQLAMGVRREAAYRVFTLQLGEYWRGIEHLRPATRALFAVFAARADHDREGASKLILQISKSMSNGQLDFSGSDYLLEKHKNNKAVSRVIQSHAYVLTVMASMLVLGRKEGVLASADFLWLKPTDRVLWFMLNSVGRQTAFSEVAGPIAHWKLECAMGRRLMTPMVEEAVNGLEAAIREALYLPDSEES